MRVLIVEDNNLLRHHLTVQIRELGHQVDAAEDSKEADYFLQESQPDIAVVDLGLPGEDGMVMIARWRQQQVKIPVMVLTARESWQEKVAALNAGADDYVTKPFQLEEIVARMQALMRRNSGLASQTLELGIFVIDLSRKEFLVDGNTVKLTAFEYTIIETLMRQLYPDAELRESHTIDVLMGRLRKKIQAFTDTDAIVTVRGQGYRFDAGNK